MSANQTPPDAGSVANSSGTSTPGAPNEISSPGALKDVKKHLRPYVYAMMAFRKGRKFQAKPVLSGVLLGDGEAPPPLTV